MRRHRLGILLSSCLLTAALAGSSLAQQPGVPGGGRQGGRGGGGQRGMGRGFGRGPLNVAGAPVEALQKPLGLSADQVKKIDAIQKKQRDSVRAMFGGGRGPGGGPGAGPGAPGGGRGPGGGAPGAGPGGPGGGRGFGGGGDMQAMMEKIRTESEKAGKEIEGVLTSAQKAKLPGVLKQLDTIRGAGIPMGAAPDLNLTPDQLNKLEALSKERQKQMESMRGSGGGPGGGGGDMMQRFQQMRTENQKKVDAILTAPQKAALKKYEDAHPRRGFGGGGFGGGGGGFGGPGGGGRGGGRPL